MNGNDVVIVRFMQISFIAFLEVIRKQNPGRPLCIVVDNARIHHAKSVKVKAEELDIHFIYLPPYCPDLKLSLDGRI